MCQVDYHILSTIQKDMRQLGEIPGYFDGILSLWQSFGYFDEETNKTILQQIQQKLRPQGRLIIDIYHRGFFETPHGTRTFTQCGEKITSSQTMNGNRLTVRIVYGDNQSVDVFDLQLYTPNEFCRIMRECGFRCMVSCADFSRHFTWNSPFVRQTNGPKRLEPQYSCHAKGIH
jgi:hypothetical protein